MSAKKKPTPCPFCGSEEIIVDQMPLDAAWRANCGGCDALGPHAPTERGALRRWNACGPDRSGEEIRKVLLDAVDLHRERSR